MPGGKTKDSFIAMNFWKCVFFFHFKGVRVYFTLNKDLD